MRVFALIALAILLLNNQAFAQALPDENVYQSMSNWMAMSAEFNDRLLGTVYWTLGTLVGLFVILLTINFFTGRQAYARDKAAMEESLRGQLAQGLAELQSDIAAGQLAFRNEQDAAFKRLGDEVKSASANARGELTRQLNEVSESVRASLETAALDFNDKLTNLEKDTEGRFDRASKWTKEQVADLKVQQHVQEGRYWTDVTKVPSNALRSYVAAIDISLTFKSYFYYGWLDEVEKLIPQVKVDADDKAKINKMLSKLPSDYSINAKKITELLS